MSRSETAVQREMMTLFPPGWIWPRGEDSTLAALVMGFASEIALVEATAEAMLDEVDPRTAVLCIGDFERVLGADPCGRDPSALSLTDRQQLAHQRWTARGGQSIAYFVDLAAKRGIRIEIEEATPTVADVAEAGAELVESPEQFVWSVHLGQTEEIIATAGASEAGDYIVAYQVADIECDIRRRRPAHTEVAFFYDLVDDTIAQLDFSSPAQSGQELDGWL